MIRHFAWIAISNTLLVKTNLIGQGVILDCACNIYDFHPKNLDHILINCPWSSRIQFHCLLGLVVDHFVGMDFVC